MTETAALTIDLEWFEHTPAYRGAAGTADREAIGIEGVSALLDALDRHDATATWFTVAAIAESRPDVLEEIVDAGHEIGSHTATHRLLSDVSPAEQRAEIGESRETLQAVTGQSVGGFRAPAFDLAEDHFERLDAAGYRYDASVVPCRAIPGWYGGDHEIYRPAPATAVDPGAPADLYTVPTAVMPGLQLPLTGTWLRFFGPRYTVLGMRLLARRGIAPVLYVHPWEFVDLPDVPGVPRRVTVRTGEWMRRAVERILSTDFAFTTVESIVAEARADGDATGRGQPARGTTE